MITLWILAILVVFVVGLGQRSLIKLKLASLQKDRLKAYFLARAGIQKAVTVLEKNQRDGDGLQAIWSTGVDPVSNKSILNKIELAQGSGESFSVSYLFDPNNNTYLCIADEERKINLNTAPQELLVILLKQAGMADEDARNLAQDMRIWRGDKDVAIDFNADSYSNFKKKPFANPEELVIVLEYFYKTKASGDYRNQARETFIKLEGFITTYGDTPDSAVNINTVSPEVLTLCAKFFAQGLTGVDSVLADALALNLINLRDNQAGKYFKSLGEINNQSLNIALGSAQEELLNELKKILITSSNYFRIESSGSAGKALKKITAVYHRNKDKNVVYWHEN